MTEKQDKARRTNNPINKQGYSKVVVHYEDLPCNQSSMCGLEKSSEKSKVTCITCLRELNRK